MEKQHVRLHHRREESTDVYAVGKARNVPGNTANAWNTGYIGGNIIGNAGGYAGNGWNIYGSNEIVDKYEKAKKEENQPNRAEPMAELRAVATRTFELPNRAEPMAELRAVATRTFELRERPAGKNDPVQAYRHKIKKEAAAAAAEQAYRHKIKKEAAAAGALGGGVHVLHKHQEKKDSKKEEKGSEGKKYRHRF